MWKYVREYHIEHTAMQTVYVCVFIVFCFKPPRHSFSLAVEFGSSVCS